MGGRETCPLPDDPRLAAIAEALNDAGYWAIIVDCHWRNLYMTDAQRLTEGGLLELAPFPVGMHICGPELLTALLAGRGRLNTLEAMRTRFEAHGPYMLAAANGGREELRELVDPRLRDIVDQISPADLVDALSVRFPGSGAGMAVEIHVTLMPVRGSDGQLVGTVVLSKHQLRHAHAVEMGHEGVPLVVIHGQLGHANLGITSIYLQGIDSSEIIGTVHGRPSTTISASAGLHVRR